ncbi:MULTISPECIES: NCS2 family permease [Clostridium]|uniref:NCS2 family permease n=1 Tax=Clostridium TaxID=1485 RepID=UPI000BE28CCC|nr:MULTISPECIES: NCS2 family permease [Clostridium]MBS5305341.1 NCS2 family permease [Clostridium sp.]MDB1934609.1 NCS2 family permease [Clostridium tertium]MDB1937856.1 NCS2 family permease [Clostridium tertium]MDB1942654.1 NCS2 family permease [Clostridium tertium]MDB1949755.1 NCS2 family permease [Clostridium tertium]
MDKLFKLKEHKTNFKTELVAGLTSFFAAVYIIVVNASILSDGGKSQEPLIIATVLASFVGCLLVSFMSNTPLVIMPGMGINALFTYTIVLSMGLSFNQALASVVMAGILFLIVAITPLSKILDTSIPNSLKESITIGIGLFITFLGFQKGGLIISDPSTMVKIGSLSDPRVIFFIAMFLLTVILFAKNIPGGFLISIVVGTIAAILLNLVDTTGLKFSLPNFNEYKGILFNIDLSAFFTIPFWISTFSLTLVLIFENIGLLHGQINGLLKAPEKQSKALNAIAISTIACGLFGTSPSVSTVEGTAGIAAGGKTGLTSLISGLLLLISLLFIPFINLIPNEVIAPILIIIGSLMIKGIVNIDFNDISEAIPSFLIIVLIPLTFSIVDGIAFGFISYTIMKLITKKKDQLSIVMYIISFVFIVYFILHSI